MRVCDLMKDMRQLFLGLAISLAFVAADSVIPLPLAAQTPTYRPPWTAAVGIDMNSKQHVSFIANAI